MKDLRISFKNFFLSIVLGENIISLMEAVENFFFWKLKSGKLRK